MLKKDYCGSSRPQYQSIKNLEPPIVGFIITSCSFIWFLPREEGRLERKEDSLLSHVYENRGL